MGGGENIGRITYYKVAVVEGGSGSSGHRPWCDDPEPPRVDIPATIIGTQQSSQAIEWAGGAAGYLRAADSRYGYIRAGQGGSTGQAGQEGERYYGGTTERYWESPDGTDLLRVVTAGGAPGVLNDAGSPERVTFVVEGQIARTPLEAQDLLGI
jgi:hypothetical protein